MHGDVMPVRPPAVGSPNEVQAVCLTSRVPVWVPWPIPEGWTVTGLQQVGDPVNGAVGVAVSLVVVGPVPGLTEMLVVAEEPGVGYAARLAGMDGPDAGDAIAGAPYSRVTAGGHLTPLWLARGSLPGAALVGERDGAWLWILIRPTESAPLAVDPPPLADLRELGDESALLPFGPLSGWLRGE